MNQENLKVIVIMTTITFIANLKANTQKDNPKILAQVEWLSALH